MKIVAIVSGGMDSVTLAHELKHDYPDAELRFISFDYGQRHVKELDFADYCADKLGAYHTVIDLTVLTDLLAASHSSLVDLDVRVPHGHYEAETMKATVVPNRNAIMLSIATGIAVAEKASFVAIGVHSGDHAIYPDCRPEFIHNMSRTMRIANEGFCDPEFEIRAPFVAMTKADIASLGDALGVNWEETWSCYEGERIHCGLCGTCVERREALSLAGLVDPTQYANV